MMRSGLRRLTAMPKPTQPMKRTKLPKRGGIYRRNPGGGGTAGMAARKTAPRDTGPDRKTRGLVLARDNFQCVGCGKPVGGACTWWSIQHRVARGVGGDNSLPNLILLCGSATSAGCHRDAENRTAESHAKGYWLRSDEDPRQMPVMICGQDGGVTAWLNDSGTYSFEPPQGDAA